MSNRDVMNQESANWNPNVKETVDFNLQGVKFTPFPPPAQRMEPKQQEGKALFVRNICREITNKELKQIFSEHGKVVSVFLKPNVPSAKYNWAIINVETVNDMLSMMSALNRKPPFNFDVSLALTEEEKKLRRTGRGETNVPSSGDSLTIAKHELDELSSVCEPTTMTRGTLNGGTAERPQDLANGAAGQRHQELPAVGKVTVQVQKPSRSELYEVGRGTVLMERSRQQACVFCGSQGQMRCSVCKAWYCSAVCQVDDWYRHKDTCRSPPVLDVPSKVQCSTSGKGGEASRTTRGANDVSLPSTASAGSCEKGLSIDMREEACLHSSPMKTLNNITQSRGSIASSQGNADTRKNPPSQNVSSTGAIPKWGIVGQNGFNVGRGTVPKRSTVPPSSNLIGGCSGTFVQGNFGTSSTANGIGHGMGIATKGSLGKENGLLGGKGAVLHGDTERHVATEKGFGRGRSAVLHRDVEGDSAIENGPARGRAAILHKDVKGDTAVETGPARGRASILQKDVEGSPIVENGPARGRGAILQKDVEQRYNIELVASVTNPAEGRQENHCQMESTPENKQLPKISSAEKNVTEEEQLPKPSTAKNIDIEEEQVSKTSTVKDVSQAYPGSVGSTPTDCSTGVKTASPSDKEASSASPEVSPNKNGPNCRLNFAIMLEKGKAYNGFITLVDSYKHFTAAVVVEGTEYIFSEAHEVFSNSPSSGDFKPEVGSLVAAFSCIEETWYRAQILEIECHKYKVCFIDFGNKEVVEKVKPIPEGPFADVPQLAFTAKFYSALRDECEDQLKKMVQVDNAIKFKVAAKKESSVKVILCEEHDGSDTEVAEYIFQSLLVHVSTSLPTSVPASETKTTPTGTKAATPDMHISAETKASSPDTKVISPETKTSFSGAKVTSPETVATVQKPTATSPDTETTFPEARARHPGSLDGLKEKGSMQKDTLATGQQEICFPKKTEEELMHSVEGGMKENECVDAGVLKDCRSSQHVPRDVNSELSNSGAGKTHSFYVVPLNTLELMMKMEEMAVEMNKYCAGAPDSPHHPRRGEVCLAKFGQDDSWYRAICVAFSNTSALVVFVDYGNIEKVLYADIRQIPKQFLELPCFALHHPRQDASGALEHGQNSALSSFAFLSPLDLPPEGCMKME